MRPIASSSSRVCLVLAAALFFWVERTRTGAIIRAAAEKPEMVEVLGIDAAAYI